MSFVLYAAGSGLKPVESYKRSIDYPQLLSQYTEKKSVLQWVEYLKNNPECKCNLFIDSGAFTAHTKDLEIDSDSYINFLNEIDDNITIAAQVDKIPGVRGIEPTFKQREEAPKQSWENYLYMKDKLKSRDKLLPVFHQGEDFKWLTNMLNYTHKDGKPIKYIGLSPSKSISSRYWAPWFSQVFKIIKSSPNPNVCTHAFGCTFLDLLEEFPLTSSDSTTWLKNAAYGKIMINKKVYFVSPRTIKNPDHFLNQSVETQDKIISKVSSYGFKMEDVLNDDTGEIRQMVNLAYLKDWCSNYKYKGNKVTKNSLF